MMEVSLAARIGSYMTISDQQLMNKLPIIVVLNGRSFSKTTSLLEKPYSHDFMELMVAAMVKLAGEVDGLVFAYTFNDQIVLALRNDQNTNTEAWYGNHIQTIVSAASSIATLELNRIKEGNNVRLLGDPIFTAKVFAVPNLTELTNTIIHMQQSCFHAALSQSCFHELLKIYGASKAKHLLAGKSPKEKSEILFTECNIEFNDYPVSFKRGVAAYRTPKFNPKNKEIKQKLIINDELPLFAQNQDWLHGILKNGTDTLVSSVSS